MSRLILQGPVVPCETVHSDDDRLLKAKMKLAPMFHHYPPKDHRDEIGISQIIWQFALSHSTPRQNCRRKFDFLDPTLPLPLKLPFFLFHVKRGRPQQLRMLANVMNANRG